MMVKILLAVTVMAMAQSEENILMFMKKAEKIFEEFEEVRLKVNDLSRENAELKERNDQDRLKLEAVALALKAKEDELKEDHQVMKTAITAMKTKDEELDCKASELEKDVSFLKNI